ncbi:MAG TPA: hypothetical protein VK174_04310 [Chitinophagales bacterium]|nr:hypothetical protein [Chitinophagales bacterium]
MTTKNDKKMKTISQKWILIAGLVTISVITLFVRPAFAGDSQAKPKQASSLKETRAAVNQALLNVNQQQKRVNELGEQCRLARDKNAPIHQQYADAKSELKRERLVLQQKAKEMAAAHKAIIKEQEGALIAQRKELHKAEAKLNKQLTQRDAAAANQAYVMVAERDKVRDAESRIEYAKINRDVDLYLVNKELRDTKGNEWFGLTVMSDEAIGMAKK